MSRAKTADKETAASLPPQTLAWVEQAMDGDRTAFHRLVDSYQPEIFRMIYYRTRSKMDAEDLTQDVFLRAFKHLRRLESPKVFRSWLYRIAVNRVHDYHRSKRIKSMFGIVSVDEETFQEPEEMAVAPEAADEVTRKDFWKQVHQLLDTLSRAEREVFMLRFFDELSIKEVASTMKRTKAPSKPISTVLWQK